MINGMIPRPDGNRFAKLSMHTASSIEKRRTKYGVKWLGEDDEQCKLRHSRMEDTVTPRSPRGTEHASKSNRSTPRLSPRMSSRSDSIAMHDQEILELRVLLMREERALEVEKQRTLETEHRVMQKQQERSSKQEEAHARHLQHSPSSNLGLLRKMDILARELETQKSENQRMRERQDELVLQLRQAQLNPETQDLSLNADSPRKNCDEKPEQEKRSGDSRPGFDLSLSEPWLSALIGSKSLSVSPELPSRQEDERSYRAKETQFNCPLSPDSAIGRDFGRQTHPRNAGGGPVMYQPKNPTRWNVLPLAIPRLSIPAMRPTSPIRPVSPSIPKRENLVSSPSGLNFRLGEISARRTIPVRGNGDGYF